MRRKVRTKIMNFLIFYPAVLRESPKAGGLLTLKGVVTSLTSIKLLLTFSLISFRRVNLD
jgi:hypothetical protein